MDDEEVKSPFHVGEKVAFLDDDVRGKVIAIRADVIVVETEDGFQYKCHKGEIVSQETAADGLTAYIKDADLDYLRHDKYSQRNSPTPPNNKAQREIPPRVLDLHIEKLVKSTRGMSSGDMLDYQMRYARAAVENARQSGHKKLVFIHGVGEGILKEELLHMINGYPRCRYYDAPFYLYGEGATEVEFF